MKNIVQLYFGLLGTKITPQEITKTLGIIPETALMRGERNMALDLPRQNVWSICSHADSDDVAQHWGDLELALNGARDKIKEIATTGVAKFTIVITCKNRIPSIMIPPSMSAFAGYVNAVIDIDHLQP